MVANLPELHNHNRGAYWNCVSRSRVNSNKSSTMPGVIRRFSGCLGGEVYRGHVEAWPEIREYLRVQDFRTLFVYRDLRDAVV